MSYAETEFVTNLHHLIHRWLEELRADEQQMIEVLRTLEDEPSDVREKSVVLTRSTTRRELASHDNLELSARQITGLRELTARSSRR